MSTRSGAGRFVPAVTMICALTALLARGMPAQPNPAVPDAKQNWRLVETLKAGRFLAEVELSSTRTLRIISLVDNEKLVSPELAVDSIRAWNERLFSQIDNPTRREYVLGNAILVQPFIADGGHIGFLLPLADTVE